ncbi:MAG: 16S rRNA (uracil(1498)-N(3))-methyltransferase [Chitinophagales bacterium]
MRRFYVETGTIVAGRVCLTGSQSKHALQVLRLQPGEKVIIFDGSGVDYLIELEEVTPGSVTGTVIETRENVNDGLLSVTLVQALGKGDKMDFIIQKAAELGVRKIIPTVTEHTVVKLSGEKATERVNRWNRVAIEACKQCGRSRPPLVEKIVNLTEVTKQCSEASGLFFYEGARDISLKGVLKQHANEILAQGVYLFIGPEGGFSSGEADLARRSGLELVGLGPRILRTETAGITAISIVMYELGDLGGSL